MNFNRSNIIFHNQKTISNSLNHYDLRVFGRPESVIDFSKENEYIGNLIHFCSIISINVNYKEIIYTTSNEAYINPLQKTEDPEVDIRKLSEKYTNLRFILTKFTNLKRDMPSVKKINNLKIIDHSKDHFKIRKTYSCSH